MKTCSHGLTRSEGCTPCDATEAEIADEIAYLEAMAGKGLVPADCGPVGDPF